MTGTARSPSRTDPAGARSRWRRARFLVLLALLQSFSHACTRNLEVGSPRPLYAIQIRNALTEEMVVSYDDGAGPRALGTVLPGGIERFLINSPASTTVSITGRGTSSGDVVGPILVRLAVAGTPLVVLQ